MDEDEFEAAMHAVFPIRDSMRRRVKIRETTTAADDDDDEQRRRRRGGGGGVWHLDLTDALFDIPGKRWGTREWKLKSLLPSMGRLRNLEVLLLARNSIRDLPSEIGDLTGLTKLDLRNTSLETLPPSIGKLKNLTDLDLSFDVESFDDPYDVCSSSKLRELPTEVGDLTSLISLRLSGSAIGFLPPSIGRLKNLSDLNLSFTTNLSELPVEIGDLTGLASLTLIGSAIGALPSSVGKLKHLRNLDLSYTSAFSDTLPEEIGGASGLTRLILEGSAISSLPSSVGKLRNLRFLVLHHTENLTRLPDEIGDLTNLASLHLVGSSVRALPPSIGRLRNLRDLGIVRRDDGQGVVVLPELPAEIGDLTSLTWFPSGMLDLVPEAGRRKLLDTLALNRAKRLYPFLFGGATADGGGSSIGPGTARKMWPRVLSRAYEDRRHRRHHHEFESTGPDAVYSLLRIATDSFRTALVADRDGDDTA